MRRLTPGSGSRRQWASFSRWPNGRDLMISDLLYRLRALFRRGSMERDLDDELRFHLERETEKLVRSGMSPADAARHARLAFGGVERIKDDSRDVRGVAWIDALTQDTRYA